MAKAAPARHPVNMALKKMLRRLAGKPPEKCCAKEVTVYTRQGCHLCNDLLRMLHNYAVTVQEIDIDGDAQLLAKYGDKVPVLAVDGKPRLWGNINKVLLRRLLKRT